MAGTSTRWRTCSGALLTGRLNAAIAALFTKRNPSACPTDPGRKQDHLWALTLEQPLQRADAHPVIVLSGVVLHAPGELNLGRTTRLANRAQRRALRGLYATCAAHGCAVKFDHCQPHHVVLWEHGGPTDLANLLPLCSRHHHLVLEGGWKLTIGPDRTIAITYLDGAVQTTGPPSSATPPSGRSIHRSDRPSTFEQARSSRTRPSTRSHAVP